MFDRPSDASEHDLDNAARLEEAKVFLRGAGTGVRGFAGSSRDPTVVDDVTVDVVSVNGQFSTLSIVEKFCFSLNGISGGVESFFVGDVPANRSSFIGVDNGGSVPVLNPRFGGLPGDRISLSNEEDAEK